MVNKRILLILLITLLLVGTVAAAEWDNTLSYENNDKTAKIKNWLGLTELGTVELKSHKTVDEKVGYGLGNQVVMWYEVNFKEVYKDGIGNIEFINMKTGKAIQRDYKIVWGVESNIDTFACANPKVTGSWDCETIVITGNKTVIDWIDYNSKDIPKGKVLVGVEIEIKPNDNLDIIWTFAGQKITKHAQVFAALVVADQDNSGGSVSTAEGMRISVQVDSTIENVTVHSSPNSATKVKLYVATGTGTGNLLTTADVAGGTATFTANATVNTSYQYFIVADNGGSSYTRTYYTGGAPTWWPVASGQITGIKSVIIGGSEFDDWLPNIWSVYSYTGSADTNPNIDLNSPIDQFNTSNPSITFNGTAYDNSGIGNVTLILDGVDNETNSSGFNNTNYLFTKTLAEGIHNWSIRVYDDADLVNTSEVRNFTVDLTNPVISNLAPVDTSIIIVAAVPFDVVFNSSTTDNLVLDTCWYWNTTENVTINCANNATISLPAGQHTLGRSANDTAGNEATELTTFEIVQVNTNVSFTDPIAEGLTDEITFNLTATNIATLTAILEYNNTNYTMVEQELSTIYGNFTYTITAPTVDAPVTVPVEVYYTLDGLNYSTGEFTQTINFVTPLEVTKTGCSAGLTAAMHFNFSDAQNLSTVENASIDYNFQFGLTELKTTSGSFADVSNFYLCINASVATNYSLGFGEIDYTKAAYSERRWYAFSSERLTDTPVNNTLYLLNSSASTSFLVTVQDPSLTNLVDKYTTLLRWYPSEDEYLVVEMGVTDGKGQTVKKVEVEDVDYRIGIYEKNGSLIFLANPIRMVCIETPCTYTLNVLSTTGIAYDNFLGVEGEITFLTDTFTFIYNDPSQATSLMNLTVSRISGDRETLLCSDSSSAFTGVLTCNISGQQGLLKAVAFRTASPDRAIDVLWIDNLQTVFQGSMGLFIMLILTLLLFLIGIFSPVVALILGVLSLIPALFLGVITYPIMIGVAILAGIVIHFMKEGATP